MHKAVLIKRYSQPVTALLVKRLFLCDEAVET